MVSGQETREGRRRGIGAAVALKRLSSHYVSTYGPTSGGGGTRAVDVVDRARLRLTTWPASSIGRIAERFLAVSSPE